MPQVDCPYCDDLHPRGHRACPGRRVGQVVAGKYRIDGILGVGGVGAVYDATHTGLGRPVALKMIHAHYAADAELSQRFVREARQASALGHPGVVAIRDVGVAEDGCGYLEMERLEGADLFQTLKQSGPLAVERAVAIAVQVLDALEATHARGIVHRDLKSANVFLVRDEAGYERTKLLDFGFVKVKDDVGLTKPGELLGSPLYMSPEQQKDPSSVDGRADLYSVGVILFEMLTGKWPIVFQNKRELLRKALLGDVLRHPKRIRPDLPEWLDAAVARAMAYVPAERFASAAAMKEALLPAPTPAGAGDGLLRRLGRLFR